MRFARRSLAALAGALGLPGPVRAQQESVLRVAMTLSDIPALGGQPDQGGEGWRFIGCTLFETLVNWDLSRADKPTRLIPGLAQEWEADPADRRRWTFRLIRTARFHDGSPFNADALIWNLQKLTDRSAPQYDPRQVAQTFGRMNALSGFEKIDDFTVRIVTKSPDSMVPYYFARIMMSSPAQWEKVGRNWEAFGRAPSGTGPWKFDRLTPRQRLELVKNTDYWDPTRIPKTDRLVLLPIPDANTRVAALLSGQVDFVEAPPPDAQARLKAAGMRIVINSYQHTWPWFLSRVDGAPTNDIRVRQAMNLAIDREGIAGLLQGFGGPAVGHVPPDHPWFGKPQWQIRYDPAEAKRLLAAAGYGPGKPLRIRVTITPSGSGQMQPQVMNEAIQEMLRAVGIEVTFEVIDWSTMTQRRGQGAQVPEQAGIVGLNNSWSWVDPDFGFLSVLASDKIPPAGNNWGNVRVAEFDRLSAAVRSEFDQEKQDALLAELHARMVEDATWLFVVHDLNPRALSPKVKGFVQARHWIQDLTPISMG
jgi:ABC-type transport system substrate-binding protein